MNTADLLYLSRKEVIELAPSPAEAVELAAGVLREHADGQVENPPKPAVHPLPDAFIHAMPGLLRGRRAVGMKWVSGFFGNPARGLPSISGLIVLNDAETGLPTAAMDCTYVTALRTAAVSAVAARHLARPGAAVLGIVGAGLQGRYNLLTLCDVLPALREVRVFDVSAETLARFVEVMGGRVGPTVRPVGSMEDALAGAEVVVTATGWLDHPIFKAAWVQEGALVLPVHSRGWEQGIFERADKFICDDWTQFRASLGAPGGFYDPLPEPYAELGEVVAGRKPGREAPTERIVDFNYGMAAQDVGMASEIFARARERGRGTVLPQLDGVLPFSE
jgi:ornithine cyclodeaminase/alanine dehydrogenase